MKQAVNFFVISNILIYGRRGLRDDRSSMMSHTGINQVILYVPLLPSGNLLLVERVDGRVYIIRNDQLLTDNSWTREQATDALAAFKKIMEKCAPKRFPGV